MSITKRGFSYQEAMAYVGVKRRTFDEEWRPRLVGMRQGSSLIFDRADLDRLFDQFKQQAAGMSEAANDDSTPLQAQNAPRNGRPVTKKGVQPWAEKQRASTPQKPEAGRSTSGHTALDFASVASSVLKKQKAG